MKNEGYGQYCPVAMAANIVAQRWTMLVIRELLLGSRRYNDIRRGVPRMSPTLLSRRLKQLEEAGVVYRSASDDAQGHEYGLTPAGLELRPLIRMAGQWGKRWVSSRLTADDLDASFLMWDIKRFMRPESVPLGASGGRTVVNIEFSDVDKRKKRWWLVVEGGSVGLCFNDPGFEVDVYIHTELRALTDVFMGVSPMSRLQSQGRIKVVGPSALVRSLSTWFGASPFSEVAQAAAA